MEELGLICSFALAVVIGFWAVSKADKMIEENNHLIEISRVEIRIGLESHWMEELIKPVLEFCMDADPLMKFIVSINERETLFQKLKQEELDLILLCKMEQVELPQIDLKFVHDGKEIITAVYNDTTRNESRDLFIHCLMERSIIDKNQNL